MDRKRDSRGLSTDRLSNLPCSIISHILTLLPLKEAARTSVLSKNWKDRWLKIPHLVFEEYTSESVISHVLLLHKEPIVKFAIKEVQIESPIVLPLWLNFLSKHRIEDLMIMHDYTSDGFDWFMLPYQFFSFYYLEHLSLCGVEVRVPSMYSGFSNLLSINLDHVFIKPEVLQRFILKCPMLESLRIVDYNMMRNITLNISTPTNLKSFKFRGDIGLIYIDSNAHLEDVTIGYDDWPKPENGTSPTLNYADQFFSKLSLINKLKVNYGFLQVLARSAPSKLTKSLNSLKHIHFERINLRRADNLIPALCLIRSSPNLQTLVLASKYTLQAFYRWDGAAQYQEAIQYLKEEQISTNLLCISLKEVRIDGFDGSEPQMEFVRLLLFSAKELRKVEIELTRSKKQFRVVKKLASFPRASSQAVILIS